MGSLYNACLEVDFALNLKVNIKLEDFHSHYTWVHSTLNDNTSNEPYIE